MQNDWQRLVQISPLKSELERLASLADCFAGAAPQQIIEWALREYGEDVAIATGFGAEGVAMIDMAAKINRKAQIFFLDTGFLFPQTYELRRRLEARYGIHIRAYRTALTPDLQEKQYGARLWEDDPDRCCQLRKLEPLGEALRGRLAWMTAIRRDQTAARANATAVEWDSRWNLVKINPLAYWSKKDVWRYILNNSVPYNPLHDAGYPSLGCTHCTRAVGAGEDDRAGRWAGHLKTECGLHIAASPPV